MTFTAGVPTIWMGMLPLLEGRDLSRSASVACGGSAVPKSLSEACRTAIGLPITQALGHDRDRPRSAPLRVLRSEHDGLSDDELADVRATPGRPAPLVELRIADSGHRRGAALGRRGARASCRPPGRGSRRPTTAPTSGGLVHRRRLAAHR